MALTPWNSGDPTYGTGEVAKKKYLGRYGMVRNNWYELQVNSISNPGSPDVPEVNPDTPDDEGYRVNSKNATAFRIWANQVLKQYLLRGYAINERVAAQKYDELSQLVKVLGRTIQNQEKLTEDSRSLLDVVVDYTYALDTLDRYDYQELKIEDTTGKEAFHATYENAMEVIRELQDRKSVV